LIKINFLKFSRVFFLNKISKRFFKNLNEENYINYDLFISSLNCLKTFIKYCWVSIKNDKNKKKLILDYCQNFENKNNENVDLSKFIIDLINSNF
jgi:hypothetical protein